MQRAHRFSVPVLAALLLTGCSSSSTGPLFTDLNGSWAGSIGGTTFLTMTLAETRGAAGTITGTGRLTSALCSQSVNVDGQGTPANYTIDLTGTGGVVFSLSLQGPLDNQGFHGTYAMTNGPSSDACLLQTAGSFELGQEVPSGVNGTFVGPWGDQPGPAVTMNLVTTTPGSRVRGFVSWDQYACSSGAWFDGTLDQVRVVGPLTSVDAADSDFQLDLRADLGTSSLSGDWRITKSKVPASQICSAFNTGPVTVTLAAPSRPSPAAERGVYFLRLDAQGARAEVQLLIRGGPPLGD